MEQITGVAIKSKDGKVHALPCPNRHCHVIWYMADELKYPTPIRGEQGFLTDKNRFLTRCEGMDLAVANGQVGDLDRPSLFSEDLW